MSNVDHVAEHWSGKPVAVGSIPRQGSIVLNFVATHESPATLSQPHLWLLISHYWLARAPGFSQESFCNCHFISVLDNSVVINGVIK